MNRAVRRLAKTLKRLMPQPVFDILDPLGHGAEAYSAAAVNGFPGRKMRVIGITGTNGKTSTAALTASLFEQAGFVVGLSTTAIYQVGKERFANDRNTTVTNPWDLQRLLKRMQHAGVQVVILEVTSHALAQNRIAGVSFEAAALTNITQDHLNYHRTMGRYIDAKARLFQKPGLKLSVLNADDLVYTRFRSYPAITHLSYGLGNDADLNATNIKLGAQGSTFTLDFRGDKRSVALGLPGRFNIENALAAAGLGLGLGLDLDTVADGLSALTAVPGRMERIDAGQPFTVIVDYAHTPDALDNLYQALRAPGKGRLIAILGAAGDRDKSTRPQMGALAARHCDFVVLTDDEPYSEEPAAIIAAVEAGVIEAGGTRSKTYSVVPDRRDAIRAAFAMAKPGDTVALTGMGHQQYRIAAGKRMPWDERQIARELLATLKQ